MRTAGKLATFHTLRTDTPADPVLEGQEPPTSHAAGSRKKGRPAAFQEEDIDWTSITPEERRKIRRRLSNRASAHRVRQRRLEMMDTLQSKVCLNDITLKYFASKFRPLRSSSCISSRA